MSEQIETYTSTEFGSIRALRDENGEPLFVAKDVAEVLGYSNPQKAVRDHVDEEDRGVNETFTPAGGTQKTTVINESGLYSLVLSSKLPKAKEFKRWVTSEVLPSIRKHGGYLAGQEHMDPERMVLASMRWLESRIKEQAETIASQAGQLEEQKPKVLFADAVSASDGTCLIGELAKMLTQAGYVIGQNRLFVRLREDGYLGKTGQNRLFVRLREDGYLGKTGQNRNVPLQRWVEQGLFRIKETAVTHADGHVTINRTTKVTGRGQTYFLRKYAGIKGDIKQQTKGI